MCRIARFIDTSQVLHNQFLDLPLHPKVIKNKTLMKTKICYGIMMFKIEIRIFGMSANEATLHQGPNV